MESLLDIDSVQHGRPWPRWALWVALIVAITVLPLDNFRGHSHWDQVNWIPFGGPRLKPFDVAANLGLFVPFGAWWPFRTPVAARRRRAIVVASALLLSASVELWQVYCHGRFPSATDLVANVAGAALGAWLVQLNRSSARRTAS
jgi:glycopeptide antibiotics resistance protein